MGEHTCVEASRRDDFASVFTRLAFAGKSFVFSPTRAVPSCLVVQFFLFYLSSPDVKYRHLGRSAGPLATVIDRIIT